MTREVGDFLSALGLSRYLDAFVANDVDHDLLAHLTDSDLRDLGVESLGHRKRILAAATALDSARSPPTQTHRVQRRQLTLMFVDLVGSTDLSNRLDLEAYREAIQSYQAITTEIVETFGGYVAKHLGDGTLAYFGFPQSHEDDVERAIRAGFALADRIPRLGGATNSGLEIRVGIETGPVVVGELVGKGAAQEHAALGSTPNLAARLQSIAEPGAVVVGPTSRRLADGAATFESMGPHAFKGFPQPVHAWRVIALAGASDRLDRRAGALGPFVGRKHELGVLGGALARTRIGQAVTVHLVGEPGIGKSRLMREFMTRYAGECTLLVGLCMSHAGSTAFHPFLDLVRRWRDGGHGDGGTLRERLIAMGLDAGRHVPYLLRALEEADPAADDVLPDLLGPRTREALAEFVIAHGRLRPTVLYINDLHWIDERSESVLDLLVRDPARRGILVVASFRPHYSAPWAEAPGVEELPLLPLSKDDASELFRDRLADDAAASEMAGLLERAGGNPLFLEELARHVASAARDTPVAEAPRIPDTLAGLLTQRVDALSPAARQTAEIAAVIGRKFTAELVGEDAASEVEELQAAGIVVPVPREGSTFRFHHALVQQVVYESLLSADRRKIHAEVARRLEARHAGREAEIAEEIARHYEAAGDTAATARYAFLAGKKAHDLFALRDAETWYGKCLALARPEDDEDAALLLARAVVNQTQVLCWNGDFPGMVDLARSHLPRIQVLGEIEEVSLSLTWIGEGYMHAGRYADSRRSLERAIRIGRSLKDDECIGHAEALLLWLDSIVAEGPAYDCLPARAAEIEELGHRVKNPYLGTVAHYASWAHATQSGRIGLAIEAAERLKEMGLRGSYPPAECWGACLLGLSQAAAGNHGEALAEARQGQEAAACGFDRLMAKLALGMTLVATGEIGEGIEILAAAPWRSERIGAFHFAHAGDVAYGAALVRAGRVDEGLAWLRDGARWFEASGNRRAACLARFELARGTDDDAEASDCLEHVLGCGDALSMHGLLAEAWLLSASALESRGELDAALAAVTEAQRRASPLGWLAMEQRVNAEARRLQRTVAG